MDTSLVTADFASFEDVVSRLILVPRDDDLCIGAKVGSHEVPTVINAACEEKVHPANEEAGDDPSGDPTESYDSGEAEKNENNDKFQCPEGPDSNSREADGEEDSATDIQPQNEVNEVDEKHDADGSIDGWIGTVTVPQPIITNMQVPVGYVLVKIRHSNDDDNNDMPELESIEFSGLFSFLRGAAFPLSLVFAPPSENSMDESGSKDGASSPTQSSSGPLDVEEEEMDEDGDSAKTVINEIPPPLSTLVSREDAAKYAKLAATELRGRLSRWGYQAATLAADAATQVKELRDEKQRKMSDEKQHRNIENVSELKTVDVSPFTQPVVEEKKEDGLPVDAGGKPLDTESGGVIDIAPTTKNPVESCFIFIQTSSGFELIQNETPTSITNESVISVRLTKDRACPVGKNGYTFQWYRSNTDGVIKDASMCPSDGEHNDNALPGWSLLRGACYAAYQPSVSDCGRQLLCIIKHEDIFFRCCYLPCIVVLEQALLDSAKKNLLGGLRSMSFGNLQGLDGLSLFHLKIDLVSNDDFISSSSIFLGKVTGGSVDESYNEKEHITHFRVEADPAKPRLFDLTCSSHGRLRLDAANRKSRESLLLALGLANFKGKLSSLTNETALFPSCESEDTIHAENELLPPDKHSLFEARLDEMNRLLQSKDFAITKLQQAWLDADARNKKIEIELESCRDAERHLKSALQKSDSQASVHACTIDNLNKAQTELVVVHERTVKALKNEKAVLQAAIDARDGKIAGLTTQLSELVKRSSLQAEQISITENLKINLAKAQERYSSAERIIASMKDKETELNLALAAARENCSKIESDYRSLKTTASKCESDYKKLKMERNSLRQRAEGLSKEMLRMNKNKSESVENEKLKTAIDELGRENNYLLEQIEVIKSERRDAFEKLQATYMAHEQSVRFQRSPSTEVTNGSCALEHRISELETVIASMSEYLSAKDMQIETLKQVNEAILNDHR
ncbi:hypothetical protein ACHAW5_000817 [Stephanodiscus triporus]|uniref:Uncharacterized protein n=1 Tax=Stephanodiscus triporus TaxID=2934178 RepID=A0ABD3N384_9STRA